MVVQRPRRLWRTSTGNGKGSDIRRDLRNAVNRSERGSRFYALNVEGDMIPDSSADLNMAEKPSNTGRTFGQKEYNNVNKGQTMEMMNGLASVNEQFGLKNSGIGRKSSDLGLGKTKDKDSCEMDNLMRAKARLGLDLLTGLKQKSEIQELDQVCSDHSIIRDIQKDQEARKHLVYRQEGPSTGEDCMEIMASADDDPIDPREKKEGDLFIRNNPLADEQHRVGKNGMSDSCMNG